MLKQVRDKVLLVAAVCSLGVAARAAESARQIDVPAGDLLTAIETVEQQADVEIVYQPEKLKGLKTSGVSGHLTTQEAVGKLLEGTRLRLSTDASTGAMLIVAVGPVANGGDASVDHPVRLAQSDMRDAAASKTGTEVEKTVELQEVVVTGTKTGTAIMEVPQSISVVTREEMAARNVRDIGEAVMYTAGVFAGGTGETTVFGGNSIQLRGFGGGGTAGFSYNEYLDGLKMVGTSYAGANLDPYLFERVEVLRGPASVLYGQNQPGGVVNTISKRPTTDRVGELRLGTGNHSHFDGAFDAGGAIGAGLRFRLTGTGLKEDLQADYTSRERIAVAPR